MKIIIDTLESYGGLGITCFIRDFITWLKVKVFHTKQVKVPKHCIGCAGPSKCKAVKK